MTSEVKRASLSPAHRVFPFCRLSLSRVSYPPSILSSASPLRALPDAWLPCPGNVGPREHRHALNLPSFSSANFFFFQSGFQFRKHDTCQRRGRLLALRLLVKRYGWGAFRREG
jgi:hypothetical protein